MMKVLVTVIVVLVVLFGVAVGVGVGRDDDASGGGGLPSWVDSLKERILSAPETIPLKDLRGGSCVTEEGLRVGSGFPCVVTVPEGGFTPRDLELRLVSGVANARFIPGGDDAITIRSELDPDARFPVFREGGTLTIQCADPAGCLVAVG